MKIIIAGAGLTGLTYALLLKRKGYEVEIYEKRPIEDIKKLDSVIYIKGKTLDVLSPFIDDEIFNQEKPKAFREEANKTQYFPEPHSSINIQDLLQALLNAATREGILIHRQYELTSFSRNDEDTLTEVIFLDEKDHSVVAKCDQLLLACGNRDIKPILGNHYHQPVELHSTYLIGARIPIDHTNFDHTNRPAIGVRPEYSLLPMIAAQLAALLFGYCPTSVGSFSVYLASLSRFVMMSTYPPECHHELSDKANQVNFLRDRLRNMRNGLSRKYIDMDFTWLEELEDKINENNIGLVTSFAKIHLPDKTLLKQGVIVIGDAFVTTPFIFGSEYNEHVRHTYPLVFNYLEKIKNVNNVTEKNAALKDFIKSLWTFILDTKKGAGKLLSLPDFVGNTVLPDGSRVNISPFYGYPISKQSLKELRRQRRESWISVPSHQQGGFLGQVEDGPQVTRLNEGQNTQSTSGTKNQLGWMRIFATSSTVKVRTTTPSLTKPYGNP